MFVVYDRLTLSFCTFLFILLHIQLNKLPWSRSWNAENFKFVITKQGSERNTPIKWQIFETQPGFLVFHSNEHCESNM